METTDKIVTTKELFSDEKIRAKFQEMLGKKAQGFIVSVLQVVASNELLKAADPNSIYNSAMVAATLDLPLNNNLGFAYIVPYKVKGKPVAQFQIGYKGFIQLAQRTGQFKHIGATRVFEGQLVENDPLFGPKFNWAGKTSDKVIGYAAAFSLINGFQKITYSTREEVMSHGAKYSQSFKAGFGLWKDEPDVMALKTVIKLLLSKYAPMSIDLQKALITDQGVINSEDGTDVTYLDNDQRLLEQEISKEDLQLLFDNVSPDLNKADFENGKRILENDEKESFKKLQDQLLKAKPNGNSR